MQLLRSSQKKKFRIRFECYALQQASFCIIPGSTASLGRLGATARKKHDSPRSYGAQRTPELGSSGGAWAWTMAMTEPRPPSTGRAQAEHLRNVTARLRRLPSYRGGPALPQRLPYTALCTKAGIAAETATIRNEARDGDSVPWPWRPGPFEPWPSWPFRAFPR